MWMQIKRKFFFEKLTDLIVVPAVERGVGNVRNIIHTTTP